MTLRAPDHVIQGMVGKLQLARTPAQLRQQRDVLVGHLARAAANGVPTWQECADVALLRDAEVAARIAALGLLCSHYPDQCALVLVNIVISPTEPIALRMFASQMMAASESLTMATALARAIESPTTGVALTSQPTVLAALSRAHAPNELRGMMCMLAIDSLRGRATLLRMFRRPDQYPRAWPAVALTLLALDSEAESHLRELESMLRHGGYGNRIRLEMVRMLYVVRKLLDNTPPFQESTWETVRMQWRHSGGDVKAVAAEVLKLQGATQ
ncbi:MAG: hypothetical protein JNL19_04640 [Burkholderiales bacterium]|nr:hypothetical protein [Burkholderiales bacterium]